MQAKGQNKNKGMEKLAHSGSCSSLGYYLHIRPVDSYYLALAGVCIIKSVTIFKLRVTKNDFLKKKKKILSNAHLWKNEQRE